MPKGCQDSISCTPPKKRVGVVGGLLWGALVAVASMAVWTTVRAQDDPAVVGQWSALQTWSTFAIHAHMLPTGKVLFWDDLDATDDFLWDPQANTFTAISGPGYLHYCTGHSFLASGQLLVVGGHILLHVGLPSASMFNPEAEVWSHLPDMNAGRWYPTVTTLSTGEAVVVSGDTSETTNNILPQVWQTRAGNWRDLTSAQRGGVLYPWHFVAPDSRIFRAGHGQVSLFLDTSGTGSWTLGPSTSAPDRDYGTGVMYAPGKVIVIGGDDPPRATAEVIDLNNPSPAWRNVNAMSGVRRQLNATLLPDGGVLVTGGSSGAGFNDSATPVFLAELWNPVTEAWTSLASSAKYRGYHSVAFLLPDGRVVTAGGTSNTYSNAEIFSPPYLFRGTRPTISVAPTVVRYAAPFFVGTPDAANIARVTWVRLSSVTHSFNANQRFNELSFTQATGGLQVSAPANGALCPPGHYLLFLLNSSGVPSVGKIVRIEVPQRRGQLVSQ